ncbi:hypothetical protein [Synechococcus sp. HK01-R]|uniref:hypothetical protein n=1 Tax=Synechococcus sp. HK01-R TaxID=2751171 RepID=UPI002106D63B|nr:hypothetical protein [Synechococcus sp. HK01-R]
MPSRLSGRGCGGCGDRGQRHLSVGAVISELARQALRRPAGPEAPPSERSGLPLLTITSSGGVVDLNLVNQRHPLLQRCVRPEGVVRGQRSARSRDQSSQAASHCR